MLVLFETAAGFAVFKLLDEKKLKKCDNLYEDFKTLNDAKNVVKLKKFCKFEDTTEALASATAAVEGKLSKGLKKFLKKCEIPENESLAIADSKLGNAIKTKLGLNCIYSSEVEELMRCIRSQISGLVSEDMKAMSLGLAHSLSRYKLKFSPDKIDTMIVQAVSLLDDLDKELNNYIMRCREWYGWHFPEMGKIVTDNIAFVRVVQAIGTREKCGSTDLSDILPEDIEEKVKAAAEISMGTEIAETDMLNIRHLCKQIVEIQEYRSQLYEYLKNRMLAVAPNVTVLVGELVGARLMSHAGSLMNLAKHPASTVQILGAEKALFKALKTKHDTPKYGLIYHAQVVGSTSTKLKGKASRMLAAKVSLACRVDALRDDGEVSTELGIEHRAKVEARIRQLEGGHSHKISGNKRHSQKFDKYENKSEVLEYKPAGDSTMKIKEEPGVKKIKVEDDNEEELVKSEKKKKKKKRKMEEEEAEVDSSEEAVAKKKIKSEPNGDARVKEEEEVDLENGEKKKKKKKKKAKND
eukprot:TRINITY_DN929_c0_g1_i1.p1 TRINITY_DN929_c0_g1~~TRINITY_DN929_c0_g1_i1.p1  ORF type:complete len:540 (-),score=227.29 TRINITY_DN929_c0_g1_i1:161-1732(-)